MTSLIFGSDLNLHFHHYYPIFFHYNNSEIALGPQFKNNSYNESKKNLIAFGMRSWDGTEVKHSYQIKQDNYIINLNLHISPLPNNKKGTLNICFSPIEIIKNTIYSFNKFGISLKSDHNIISSFSGDTYLSADYGDSFSFGKEIIPLKSTNSHHKFSEMKSISFEDSTLKIDFDMNGNLNIEPIKL